MRFLAVILCFISVNINANENIIKLSQLQVYNLGVKIGPLKTVKEVPLLYAPAKVVIPPSQEYIVSAPQSALVSQLKVMTGDSVKKGQLVAQLKSPELLNLQQQFLRALSAKQLAWANYQRDKKLFDEGIIARKRWQEARSHYNNAESEVSATQQLLQISGMSKASIKKVAKTRRLNSQLNIYAPVTGIVLETFVVTGERLEMLAPLYRIANLDQLWLEIKLPQEQVNNVKIGDQIVVQNTAVKAKISLLGQSVNKENQTVLARAIIHQPTHELRAGQKVNTQIIQTSYQVFFEVPNAAIAQREGQAYIFVRLESGFEVKAIKVVGKHKDYSVITADLNGTEDIALRGAAALKANWIGLGEDE